MNMIPSATLPLGPTINPWTADGQRLLLHNVSWASYVEIRTALSDSPALRVTYDRGKLELMTTSTEHEKWKDRLIFLVQLMALELGRSLASAGQMTFQREELDRGFEPDQCFWFANEAAMRSDRQWLPDRDPPPDLILEIEWSRSAIDRMSLFAAYGVSEVWRFDGARLSASLLQADGTYEDSERSPIFPTVQLASLVPYLRPDPATDWLTLMREFQAWIRSLAVGG